MIAVLPNGNLFVARQYEKPVTEKESCEQLKGFRLNDIYEHPEKYPASVFENLCGDDSKTILSETFPDGQAKKIDEAAISSLFVCGAAVYAVEIIPQSAEDLKKMAIAIAALKKNKSDADAKTIVNAYLSQTMQKITIVEYSSQGVRKVVRKMDAASSFDDAYAAGPGDVFYTFRRNIDKTDFTLCKIEESGKLTPLQEFKPEKNAPLDLCFISGPNNKIYVVKRSGMTSTTVYELLPSGKLKQAADLSGRYESVAAGNDADFYAGSLDFSNMSANIVHILRNGEKTIFYCFDHHAPAEYHHSEIRFDKNFGVLYTQWQTNYETNQTKSELLSIDKTGAQKTLLNVNGDIASLTVWNGDLYASSVNANGFGDIRKIDPAGKIAIAHQFAGGNDGQYACGLLPSPDGYLYGLAQAKTYVVFRVDKNGKYERYHQFDSAQNHLMKPINLWQIDKSGRMLFFAPAPPKPEKFSLFELTKTKRLKTICSYSGPLSVSDEALSRAGPLFLNMRDPKADYSIAEIASNGALKVVHKFDAGEGYFQTLNNSDWGNSGEIAPDDGSYFGLTKAAYDSAPYVETKDGRRSILFEIDPKGNFRVLHRFPPYEENEQPIDIDLDNRGNIYGVTRFGGQYGRGSIFRVDKNGEYRTLYSFAGGDSGDDPQQILCGGDGFLYGFTKSCGDLGEELIFRFSPK